MSTGRRECRRLSAAPARLALGAAPSVTPAPTPLTILLLPGPGFTGPAQAAYTTARGHRVTLLDRE